MVDRIHEILKKYWGYKEFRPLQQDIIESVLNGNDTLGLMPTGGGKSITFQVPTMAMDGIAIVVTPIISLMKDQVDNLISHRIKATYMHAGLTMAESRRTIEKCVNGGYKFLYVSPERLGSENFISNLKHMPVCLIVVDEAHCISQWGYDFRPSFLNIASIRKLFPEVPVLALTATAPPIVVDDIMEKLEFRGRNVFRKSFKRDNLSYVVRHTDEKYGELVHILKSVAGSGIVYVRSRRKTKLISDLLCEKGIKADYYHAGLAIEDKEAKQNKWKNNEIRVIVATNAFGMGIDKPDVRIVVHIDMPNSLEEYYQEAGRAGRDGRRSYAVLLASPTDKATLKRHVNDAFPEREFIRNIYEKVGDFLNVEMGEGFEKMFDFNFSLFCTTFKLPILPTHSALKLLTQSGHIEFIEEIETQSRVMITANKESLYHIDSTVPDVDKVLNALLRSYTGLFADYVFINEDTLSFRYNISPETIYKALIELSRLHVLHYVPRKRTPYIIYTYRRQEAKYVLIPKTIYEERRSQMESRINAVLDYAFNNESCRESRLLTYFGDNDNAADCGHCDVCIDKKKKSNHTLKDVQEGILYMSQVKPRRIEDFVKTLSFPQNEIMSMLSFLVDEGFIEHLPDDTYRNPVPLEPASFPKDSEVSRY